MSSGTQRILLSSRSHRSSTPARGRELPFFAWSTISIRPTSPTCGFTTSSPILKTPIRCFRAVGEKFLFMGHHHQWLIIGSDGSFMRDIEQPVTLAPAERYLVVMGALVDGWCATFDSVTATLTPIRCDDSVET